MRRVAVLLTFIVFWCGLVGSASAAQALEPNDPETVVRRLVQANAELDLATLSSLMAHDADITSYSIGGRKYVGWPPIEQAMRDEFAAVTAIDIPIHELKVWRNGPVAWFTMEVDYIRTVGAGTNVTRTVLPLRETGVLEQREGRWVLLSWHESYRTIVMDSPSAARRSAEPSHRLVGTATASLSVDLGGEWEILEVEDDKRYKATLDKAGNGPYTQHGGRFTTTQYADRLWQGTWQQPGNDREGGFELLLSEDGQQAKGIWWYTRVGTHKNIPPKEHGGTYLWKRTTSPSVSR